MNELLVRLGLRRGGKIPKVAEKHRNSEDRAGRDAIIAGAPDLYSFAPLEMTPERRKIVDSAPPSRALIDELRRRRASAS